MSDQNDALTMTALGRFEPGDIDPEAFHVLLTGSPRAVGRAGQFLGEAVEITTADTQAAALARAERAEALLAEAVEALRQGDTALEEAEAILGGEYDMHHQFLCDSITLFRATLAKLEARND